jgi:hyperosmotically inducible protein
MKMRTWMRTWFIFASVVLLAPVLAVAQQKPSDQVFTGGSADETQLAKEVRHNLLMLPYYSIFDDLSFSVNGSVVTLQGACPPEPPWDIKSDAEAAVKKVKGVTQVVNNIKELPLSPMDWQIRRAEERVIYGDADLGTRYGYQALPPIHIIVDNGHVTLTGVVASTFDKNLINVRANTVPGVFSVDNNLVVADQGKNKENVSSANKP